MGSIRSKLAMRAVAVCAGLQAHAQTPSPAVRKFLKLRAMVGVR